jgi:cytoskeletal protein CcmA (bactofilin family)
MLVIVSFMTHHQSRFTMSQTQLNLKELPMFRRKEDGSEILDELPESENDNSSNTETSSAYTASESASKKSSATTSVPPVTPAATASQPVFRPSTPSAAMGARATQPLGASSTSSGNSNAPASMPSGSPATASTPKSSKRVLTVGPDIQMKGEITTCDRVVIEGAVDATLTDVHTVELAQSGSLKGTAEVEDAEISGSFEGDLIVRGRLIVYSTGIIRGNVTYGEIEIERGGQISGSIRNVDETSSKATSSSGKSGSQRRAA